MQATITKDTSRGSGFGIIIVPDVPDINGTPDFTIERPSDGRFLSDKTGWVVIKQSNLPDKYVYHNGILSMTIGPSILNQLDSLETYRISISGGHPFALELPEELPQGSLPQTLGILGMTPYVEKVQPATPETELQPPPEKPSEGPSESKATIGIQETPLVMDPPILQKRKSLWPPAVLLLLLTAGSIGLWYGFHNNTKEERAFPNIGHEQTQAEKKSNQAPLKNTTEGKEIDSEKANSTQQLQQAVKEKQLNPDSKHPDIAMAPPSLAQSNPDEQQSTTETKRLDSQNSSDLPPSNTSPFLTQARTLLREGAKPQTSVHLAKPMRRADATPQDSDGAFLLLEDAAQKGNIEAMVLLAQFYDPNSTLPKGTIEPDIRQAKDWYKKAADAGSSEASNALNTLHDWVENKASAGDSGAADLIKNW